MKMTLNGPRTFETKIMNQITIKTLNGELTLSQTESGGLLVRLHRKDSPLCEQGEIPVKEIPALVQFLEDIWLEAYQKKQLQQLG